MPVSGADPLVVETVERMLAGVCTPESIEESERDGWSRPAWDALAATGFPWVGVREKHGGSGGTLHDAAAILRAVGRHAANVPLAETGLLGGACLAAAGLAIPEGPLAVVEPRSAVEVDGPRLLIDAVVAWARHAERIVAVTGGIDDAVVWSLRPDQVTIVPGCNLAGEARDRVIVDVALTDVDHDAAPPACRNELELRGAASRVVMAAGALSTVSQMTIDYTNDRRQFGKPVATFQAVQSHLVVAAQSAVRAQMAADIAVRALVRGSAEVEVAAARVVVADAIGLGTRAAHQAHGAIGVTREYPLHQFTRRLWSWRHEWGTTTQWRRRLGKQVAAAGPDALFPLITGDHG
jgi:acyl-CoA dehydrogenase